MTMINNGNNINDNSNNIITNNFYKNDIRNPEFLDTPSHLSSTKFSGIVKCTVPSSAHSSSAHPDEDWTKIKDLAERRRIQNRIAQRNYRKKLKRRMEELKANAEINAAKANLVTTGQINFDYQPFEEVTDITQFQLPPLEEFQVPSPIDFGQCYSGMFMQDVFVTSPPPVFFSIPGYQPQYCLSEL